MGRPAPPPLPSIRPALVVVGLAVFIVLAGSVLALVGTSSARPAASHAPARRIPGTRLGAQPATAVIAHIAAGGEPPADVVAALAVPAGSRYLGKDVESRGVSQFDSSVRLSVPDPEGAVRNFYLKLLSDEHWVSSSLTSPHKGASEIIAQRNGSDGYQWRVGIVMSGVRTVVAPALAGDDASPARTTLSIELYQVEDAS